VAHPARNLTMKLLVATDFNPNSPGGGPAVIRQMLTGFREAGHSISWWSCRREEQVGENFFVDYLARCPIPRKLIPAKKFPKIKSSLLYKFWAPIASTSLQRNLQKIQPECVWAIPHNLSILPIYQCLSRKNPPAFRFHTTIQDYPDAHNNQNLWGKLLTNDLIKNQYLLYKNAQTRDATSLQMIAHLKELTGKKGSQMLHEGLEIYDFNNFEKQIDTKKNCDFIKILFIGTILAEKELVSFIDAMKLLQTRKRVQLDFAGAHSYRNKKWFDSSWMSEFGNLPRSSLVELTSKYDFGFISMPLYDNLRYSKYSFPTKFISYLSSGVSQIIIARADSAVYQMAEKYQIGIRIQTDEPSSIAKAIEDKTSTPGFFEQDKRNMLICAKDNFDAVKMRKILWQSLENGKSIL
jgi:glycosyltransferase involved in cell wall biosynthesis